jgi:hypothetical protein
MQATVAGSKADIVASWQRRTRPRRRPMLAAINHPSDSGRSPERDHKGPLPALISSTLSIACLALGRERRRLIATASASLAFLAAASRPRLDRRRDEFSGGACAMAS